jgi:hypothetical protein
VKQGSELREIMREVSKLRAADKTRAAQAKLESAATGNAAGKRITSQRAGEMADLLFKCGGLEATRAVLEQLLARSDVAQLLSDAVATSRAKTTDAKTARAMLEAAKAFFNQLMPGEKRLVKGRWAQSKVHSGMTYVPEHWVAGGRRSLADRNAFWASAAALLPRDIFQRCRWHANVQYKYKKCYKSRACERRSEKKIAPLARKCRLWRRAQHTVDFAEYRP